MTDPYTLSEAEIDQYSIQHFIASSLASDDWDTVKVFDVSDGWPVYEELYAPGVYVLVGSSRAKAPFELGSHAKTRTVNVDIIGENDAQRIRLADAIENYLRDDIPIYNYVDGNETDPSVVEHFVTDSVGWRKISATANAPQKTRWRSVVTASLRRVTD